VSAGDARPFVALRVARIVQETADARSFVLDVPAPLRERFAYRAGQFLTFEVPWAGGTLGRCYSLSSSPACDAELAVTVKRVAAGRVSNWFHDAVAEGDLVRVLPPAGRFVLREGSARPLALFGGGSGITPVYSILRTALAATSRRARLLYANRDRASVIFRDALDDLARRHTERFDLAHHLDDQRGLLDAAGVRRALEGFEGAEFYLCGPATFMDLVEGVLREAGVPREHILIERFLSPPDGELPGDALDPPAAATDAAPAEIVARLDGALHRFECAPDESLLAAARRAGLAPPSACEESFCGCCMARLVRGEVTMARCEALDADERDEGWILTCQARPASAELEIHWD
jgi:3-ketosteroid 9alpha-monooxygenase subunit B